MIASSRRAVRSPARRGFLAQRRIGLRHRPAERIPLARPLLKRRAMRRDRSSSHVVPLSRSPSRSSALLDSSRHRPVERSPLACTLLKRLAKAVTASSSRAVPLSRSPRLGAPRRECSGCRPVERHALARPFLQRHAKGRDRLLEPHRPASALAEVGQRNAEIVLVCAQARGTRSRVCSWSAER